METIQERRVRILERAKLESGYNEPSTPWIPRRRLEANMNSHWLAKIRRLEELVKSLRNEIIIKNKEVEALEKALKEYEDE